MATPIKSIRTRNHVFMSMRVVGDLCSLIKESNLTLSLMAEKPRYRQYSIRKKDGSKRLIEDPDVRLKAVLRILNDHLQAVYYYLRPGAVHGFTISSTSDDTERNIVSNARAHMQSRYMLNLDLKDFFHQISQKSVVRILRAYLDQWDDSLVNLVAGLCCFKGRLPMGSPTSPVLSNFTMLELDHELMTLCKVYDVVYTRYADDLTFSAQEPISPVFKDLVSDAILQNGFEINSRKVRNYSIEDMKIVTGIIVTQNELCLPEEYMHQLRKEIDLYRNSIIVDAMYETGMSGKKLSLFEQEITGKLSFAKMVMQDNQEVKQLETLFYNEVDVDSIMQSWLDIPYIF